MFGQKLPLLEGADPDSVAIDVGASASFTYADLIKSIAGLREQLPTHTGLIVLATRHRLAALVGILAAERSGIPFIIVDPSEADAVWLRGLIANTAGVLLGTARLVAALMSKSDDVCTVRGNHDEMQLSSRGILYLTRTSGSTNSRRLVAIGRAGFSIYADSIADRLQLSKGTRGLAVATPSFDVFIEETLPVLSAGGTVVIPREPRTRHPLDFLDTGISARATLANFPSSVATALIGRAPARWGEWETLETLVVGSERTDALIAERWRRAVRPDARLLHAFGLCETTITNFLLDVTDEQSIGSQPLPIGNSLAGVQFRFGGGSPQSEAELELAGTCLAIGYLRSNPGGMHLVSLPLTEDGYFRTGDCFAQRDGRPYFKRRRDGRRKVRGSFVDRHRIEDRLARRTDVVEAAVVVDDECQSVVGYVVVDPESNLSALDVMSDLRLENPDDMPDRIVLCDFLPVGPTGKAAVRAHDTPEVLERVLQVLEAEIPTPDGRTFSEFGIDSLASMELTLVLEERLGWRGVRITPSMTIAEVRSQEWDQGASASNIDALRLLSHLTALRTLETTAPLGYYEHLLAIELAPSIDIETVVDQLTRQLEVNYLHGLHGAAVPQVQILGSVDIDAANALEQIVRRPSNGRLNVWTDCATASRIILQCHQTTLDVPSICQLVRSLPGVEKPAQVDSRLGWVGETKCTPTTGKDQLSVHKNPRPSESLGQFSRSPAWGAFRQLRVEVPDAEGRAVGVSRAGMTPARIALRAFLIALQASVGSESLPVAVTVGGRDRVPGSALGPFAQTRTVFAEHSWLPPLQWSRQVEEALASEHSSEYLFVHSGDRTWDFAKFSFEDASDPVLALPAAARWVSRDASVQRRAISCSVSRHASGLGVELRYRLDAFTRDDVVRIARAMRNELLGGSGV